MNELILQRELSCLRQSYPNIMKEIIASGLDKIIIKSDLTSKAFLKVNDILKEQMPCCLQVVSLYVCALSGGGGGSELLK